MQYHKNSSNNIKMILNPCLIEQSDLEDFNKQITKNDLLNSLDQQSKEIVNSNNQETSEVKRIKTHEENKHNIDENFIKKHQINNVDYNIIKINNQYNVSNLYNEVENNKREIKNRINSTNQKLPASLVEQHNIKAIYMKNLLKTKKNPLLNSGEKPKKNKDNEDFPTINNNNNSRELSANRKIKDNRVINPKFIQLSDKNIKNNYQENNSKINNSRTPNNFKVKKIGLNLNLDLAKNHPEYNYSTKHNNIPKLINKRDSAILTSTNKTKLQENLKNIYQEKSLFANKNFKQENENSVLENLNPNKVNDNSLFANKDIEFHNSKMNNFDYSFVGKKSNHNSHRKLNIPNIPSNNISNNKSSSLLKSEDNSYVKKNIDNIYKTYENYEDGNSFKKDNVPLQKITKYYSSNITKLNPKKLKINLPSLNFNYGLSLINNPNNYSNNIKDRIMDLSTNDNLLTNPSYNLDPSSNNRSNYLEKNYKYSPINTGLPVADIFSKKTPINNISKIKKVASVNYNK